MQVCDAAGVKISEGVNRVAKSHVSYWESNLRKERLGGGASLVLRKSAPVSIGPVACAEGVSALSRDDTLI